MSTKTLQDIVPVTVRKWLEDETAELIDIREDNEYREEHIEGAKHLPLSKIEAGLIKVEGNPDKIGVIHCRSGGRVVNNTERWTALNYKEVYNLVGGILAWKAANLPVKGEERIDLA